MAEKRGADIARTERVVLAVQLRRRGWGYQRIGVELGCSTTSAYRDVQGYLDGVAVQALESAEELRRIEVDRLDACIAAIWDQVEQGHLGAIDRVLRIGERRARLLGLDAPGKTEITGRQGGPIQLEAMSHDDLQAYVAHARAVVDLQLPEPPGPGEGGGGAGEEGSAD